MGDMQLTYGGHLSAPCAEWQARNLAESSGVPFDELLRLWAILSCPCGCERSTLPEELAACRVYRHARGLLEEWEKKQSPWRRWQEFDIAYLCEWIMERAGVSEAEIDIESSNLVDDQCESKLPPVYRNELAALRTMLPAQMVLGWEGAVLCRAIKSPADLESYLRKELDNLRSSMTADSSRQGEWMAEAHEAWRNAWRVFDALDILDRPERGDDPNGPYDIEQRLSDLVLWLRKRAVHTADDVEWIGPHPIKEWSKRLHVSTKTIDRWRKNGDIRTKAGPGKFFFIDAASVSARETNRDILRHPETNGDTVRH